MYEYAPVFAKKKEKLLTFCVLALGLVVYFTSYVPGIPLRPLFQLLGIGCIVVMILLFSLVLSRHYVYSISAEEGESPDFIITEYYGKRISVVCRVSLFSVKSALPRTEESRRMLQGSAEWKHVYHYTGVLFDEERYYLRINEGGEQFVVEICADQTLIRALTNH